MYNPRSTSYPLFMKINEVNNAKENDRSRNFHFVSYVPPCEYIDILRGCKHYAWIKHDNPVDLARDDGEHKEVHYHCVVAFPNPRFISALVKRCIQFKEEYGTTLRVEPCVNLRSSLLYLTHENDKAIAEGKYKYDVKNVSCDDMTWYNTIVSNGDVGSFSNNHFMRAMLTLTPFEVAMIYGRDYMKNFKQYQAFMRECIDSVNGDVDTLVALLDNDSMLTTNLLEATSAIDAINGTQAGE